MHRYFLAIVPDKKSRDELIEAIIPIRKHLPDENIRWVEAKYLHITMRFFGHLSDEQCQSLLQALTVISKLPPFDVTVQFPHLFPTPNHPSVIALTATPLDKLQAIYQRIEAALANSSIEADNKPFRPHLTIAKIKKPFPSPACLFHRAIKLSFRVNSMLFFDSSTVNGQHDYRCVAHFQGSEKCSR